MKDEWSADAMTAVESPIAAPEKVAAPRGGNGDYPWDAFDSVAYFNHNYQHLRDDDRQILEAVRGFFSAVDLPADAVGVDVGPGANLYPALSMLPLCREIVLWEKSHRNIAWLRDQVRQHGPTWDEFWELLACTTPYLDMKDPWTQLRRRVQIKQGSVFELPREHFDIGTMFFVAESISTWMRQFEEAIVRFVGALRPGAPFAAAFMCDSKGYRVGDIFFPAVPVTSRDIYRCVSVVGRVDDLIEIGKGDNPLREDYDGMALVTGWRK